MIARINLYLIAVVFAILTIKQLATKDIKGLVIDLRNNSGGLLMGT